jgi:hypothetical protein
MFDYVTGKFLIIYPNSDLANFSICLGDSFLAIKGQSIITDIHWFQDMTRGIPGNYANMTILHDDRPIEIRVMLKDSRLFSQ